MHPLCFWWLCVKRAFRGSVAFANSWQGLVGVPAIAGLAGLAKYLGILPDKPGLNTGNAIADAVLAALAAGLAAFIITWLVGFSVRLFSAPAALYDEEKARADGLQAEAEARAYPHREGAFQRAAREALDQKSRIAFGLEIDPHALQLSVGNEPPFSRARVRGLHGRERTLYLKAENTDRRHAISGCRVYLMEVEPSEHSGGPWLLKSEFALAAGDHLLVPLVSFGEPWGSVSGDSFMTVLTPEPAPKPSASGEHTLTLRATSLTTTRHEIKCRLWVDAEGRLRIEQLRFD